MLSRLVVLVSVLGLAACGGGGSVAGPVTTPPTIAPTNAPPVTYSLKLIVSGGDTGVVSTSSTARHPMSGTSYAEFTAPDSNTPGTGFTPGGFDTAVTAQAVVSPAPPAGTSAVFSTTANGVVAPTPNPGQTPQPLAQTYVATLVRTITSGAIQATAQGLTSTQPIIVNDRATIGCNKVFTGTAYDNEYQGGIAFSSTGVASFVSDPANADVAIKGPNCQGLFKDATLTQNVMVCPHGCLALGDGANFGTMGTAQYTAAQGSYPTSYFFNGGLIPYTNLFVTTAAGKTVKWHFGSFGGGDGNNTPAQFSGGYCQLGVCLDGT